jgi:adenylate cyclase
MSLWGELRRRNIFRVAAAYLVLSWLLIQVADTIAPMMNLSDAAPRFVLFLLIVLFPVVLFLAWVFEITPDGIKQTSSVSSSESVTQVTGRKLNYIVIGLLARIAHRFTD